MRILLLGATGATGRSTLARLLADGHEVTALVRDPAKLPVLSRLRTVPGDARSVDDVGEAMRGADATVSCLGTGLRYRADDLILRTTEAVVDASDRTGVRRVVMLSAFGVGDTRRSAGWPMRQAYRLMAPVFDDKARGEALLRASALDWTIAYAVTLTNGARRGGVRVDDMDDVRIVPGVPFIARRDVADQLVALAVDGGRFRRGVLLRYG
ncbi:MAG TPA: NAD(P)-binding oxidoreductase [Rhodoglobus sp.]|nr:NAD(P)-binding oxidoreductase [Rhodoglobus sp.]